MAALIALLICGDFFSHHHIKKQVNVPKQPNKLGLCSTLTKLGKAHKFVRMAGNIF
jgi:hypothetical protein